MNTSAYDGEKWFFFKHVILPKHVQQENVTYIQKVAETLPGQKQKTHLSLSENNFCQLDTNSTCCF